jgi:hypothetical protein
MAVSFVRADLGSSGTSTTSGTITLGATAADDIIILVLVNGGATAALTPGGTYSGGAWTSIGSGAGTAQWGGVWWSRATGNHSGQTITWSGATDSSQGAVAIYSGCEKTGSPVDTSVQNQNSVSTNISLGALTTTVNDAMVILAMAADDNIASSAQAVGALTMTERFDYGSSGGADSIVMLAERLQAASGNTGVFTGTHASTLSKRLVGFALKPYVPPAYTGGITHDESVANFGVSATASVTLSGAPTAGQLIVLMVGTNTIDVTFTPEGTGWSGTVRRSTSSGPSAVDGQAWYKISDGTEGAQIDVALSASAEWALTVSVYNNIHPTIPVVGSATQANISASVTDLPSTAISESGHDTLLWAARIIRSSGHYTGSAETLTPEINSAVTERTDNGGNQCSVCSWDGFVNSSSGSYGGQVTNSVAQITVTGLIAFQFGAAGTPKNDSDTGSGADATGALATTITNVESTTGTDAGTPSAQLASSDTGTAVENAVVAVPKASSDSGTGADNATLAASIPVSDGSAGAATYGDQQYGWGTYGGTYTSAEDQTLTAQFTQTDSGAGVEDAIIALSVAESGSFVDDATVQIPGEQKNSSDSGSATDAATVAVAITQTETGTATETVTLVAQIVNADFGTVSGINAETANVSVPVASSDSGVSTQAQTLTAVISGSDSGGVVDSASVTRVVITSSDSAIGTDNALVGLFVNASETGTATEVVTLKAVYSNADTSTGSETGTLSAVVPTADSNGVTTESTALTVRAAETGAVAEGVSLVARYTVTDVNLSFVDVGGTGSPVVSGDTGTSTQTTTLVAQIPSSQTAVGVDAATVKAVYSDTDSGTGQDAFVLVARYVLPVEVGVVVDTGVAGAQQAISVSDTFSVIEVATKQELVTVGALAKGRVVVVQTVNGQVKVNLGKSRITVNHTTGRVERIR